MGSLYYNMHSIVTQHHTLQQNINVYVYVHKFKTFLHTMKHLTTST